MSAAVDRLLAGAPGTVNQLFASSLCLVRSTCFAWEQEEELDEWLLGLGESPSAEVRLAAVITAGRRDRPGVVRRLVETEPEPDIAEKLRELVPLDTD